MSLLSPARAAKFRALYRTDVVGASASHALALRPARSGWLGVLWGWVTDSAFRAARSQLLDARVAPASTRQLYLEVEGMAAASDPWAALSQASLVPPSSELEPLQTLLSAVGPQLERLGRVLAKQWDVVPLAHLLQLVTLLLGQADIAKRVPSGRALKKRLAASGLEPFLDEMKRDSVPSSAWSAALQACWVASALDELGMAEPALLGADRTQLDRTVETFRQTDSERIRLTAARVVRRHAERTMECFNERTAEHQLLKKEASKKARHMPFRDLLEKTAAGLTTLCPCVMASPLSVSQLLPARPDLFDVVIFDEASQVQPEDAAPALLRAKQVVVAGDPKQLPPTAFFATELEQDETDALVGLESVLDALLTVLPSWKLAWHYRSHDERLIAYSNYAIYDNALVTFPGVNREPALVFEEIPFVPRAGQEDSSSEEVQRVVAYILDHARNRPHLSLGVIALGIKHRDRIQHALDAALEQDRRLGDFFNVKRRDRFFVKNLEQVQGDERDVIFLSIGYCKTADGRLPYRFGPILHTGGERRLNVATTRAKHRMVVFSAFSHLDMDPSRSSAEGVKFLRGFLEFASSGGRVLGGNTPLPIELNPFEEDVRLALESRAIKVIPQLGVSNYRLDFAVQHPEQEGRFVLAIECDGASYHSAPLARDRDRLRQQQLEALGWRIHRIWSTDWFQRKGTELQRAEQAVKDAITAADAEDTEEDAAVGVEVLSETGAGEEGGQAPADRGAKPWVPANPKIESLSHRTIVEMIQWVNSDGLLRTDEELTTQVARELGFRRLGPRIKDRIMRTVATGGTS